MAPKKPDKRRDKTDSGYRIPLRKRSAVMQDFELAAGPLRGRNRAEDEKPQKG
jgi:hypothetical protein